MIVFDNTANKTYRNFKNTGSEITINTKRNGRYSFSIYSLQCKDKIIDKTISLPIYNKYYNDPLCDGLEGYSQCQRWSGYNATRKEFEQDISSIKEQLLKQKTETPEKNNEKLSLYDQIVNVFIHFWWAIVIVLIIIYLKLYY